METETKENFIILKPSNSDNWLTDGEYTFAKAVTLPLTASTDTWSEITLEEKETLEAEHEAKMKEEMEAREAEMKKQVNLDAGTTEIEL